MRMGPSRFRKSPPTPFELGLEAYAGRRYEEAINYFSAATSGDKAAEAFSKRGVCKLRLRDPIGAAADFEAALAVDPRCAQALTNLGNLALVADRLDEARTRFEAAIAADPAYPLAHHNYAVLLRREGKLPESVRELRLAGKLEGGSIWEWLTGKRRR